MHVLITGSAGMIGRKLTARLVAEGLGGRPVERLTLVDVAAAAAPDAIPTQSWAADLCAPGEAGRCVAGRPTWCSTWPPSSRARRRPTSSAATR